MPNLQKRSFDLARTKIEGGNGLKIASIKNDILDSGITSIYIKMALTGEDIRVDAKGKAHVVGELEQSERMKAMKAVVDYVIPRAKETTEETQSSLERWAKHFDMEEKKTLEVKKDAEL